MRIVNYTDYSTEQLRKVFSMCLAEVNKTDRLPSKDLIIEVKWQRGQPIEGRGIAGRAYIGKVFSRRYKVKGTNFYGFMVKMLLPKTPWKKETKLWGMEEGYDFSQRIAEVFIHELGHCLGIRGHNSKRNGATFEDCFGPWIWNNIGNEKTPICIEERARRVVVDIRYKRYQQAIENLKRAETRLKRAQTLKHKWEHTVKYYEKTLGVEKEEHNG
jgi:hypothetical protein